eukprot:1138185-Pelagomonas_calceolata.AAC.2
MNTLTTPVLGEGELTTRLALRNAQQGPGIYVRTAPPGVEIPWQSGKFKYHRKTPRALKSEGSHKLRESFGPGVHKVTGNNGPGYYLPVDRKNEPRTGKCSLIFPDRTQ